MRTGWMVGWAGVGLFPGGGGGGGAGTGGFYLREKGMENLGGSFLGLEPDGMTILLLGQHSQCHCNTDEQAQKLWL